MTIQNILVTLTKIFAIYLRTNFTDSSILRCKHFLGKDNLNQLLLLSIRRTEFPIHLYTQLVFIHGAKNKKALAFNFANKQDNCSLQLN
jgi:hypothetical protein